MRVTAVIIAALALMAGIRAAAADTTPAHIATYNLAMVPDAQLDGWSASAADGSVQYRTVAKGKTGNVKVKAWWKAGDLRPSEGETYILEVKYRDVLTNPAQVSAFSGIGWRFIGSTPLHRMGGANDGRWKTACIPVPWDMVGRLVNTLDAKLNAPDMTQFSFNADGDLPIASLVIRKAVPEDEARFYAECRAQIAAEQAEPRAKTPMPSAKDAVPASAGALAAYPWDPGCRLFPYNNVQADALGKPVKIRMCLDQFESGSFGVFANGAPLTGVDYEITPLKDASGNVLQAAVERRTAEYTLLDGKWSPVRLWPAYAVDVQAGRSHWFFFTLETRRGVAKPGTYTGQILIGAKEAKTALPLEVEVLPVDLLTIDEAGITMFGCYDKTPPLHDISFERRYNYGGALLWYTQFVPPVALKDGKLVFDFTYVDDWMKGARKRGFTGAIWYLGGDPFRLPNSAKVMAQLGTLDGKMTREAWCAAQKGQGRILPETRALFVEWMRQVNHHAVDNGWLELFPTPHDEPQKFASAGAWIKPFFKDGCAAIREADPRIRVYGCIHHVKGWHGIPDLWSTYIDDIDVYNTNAISEDNDVGNKVRAAGKAALAKGGHDKLFWQYTGLGDGVPESQRYTFGFYFGTFGSSGCTAWAYNWGDGWDLSGRKGDLAVTAWPTVYQTIPSPWMEGQREGLDDRRIIATYQKRFANDVAAMKVLENIFQEVKGSHSKHSGSNTEAGFFDSVDDTAKLTRWRNALLDKLAAVAAK